MSKPKASIIVPVYGVEQYLAGCLDPLMNQRTTIPYEVVIVDDGSKDNSGKIAESYHQNIQILSKLFIQEIKDFQWLEMSELNILVVRI